VLATTFELTYRTSAGTEFLVDTHTCISQQSRGGHHGKNHPFSVMPTAMLTPKSNADGTGVTRFTHPVARLAAPLIAQELIMMSRKAVQ
jgi:hypothetical protein